jgi:hypothetical protein
VRLEEGLVKFCVGCDRALPQGSAHVSCIESKYCDMSKFFNGN